MILVSRILLVALMTIGSSYAYANNINRLTGSAACAENDCTDDAGINCNSYPKGHKFHCDLLKKKYQELEDNGREARRLLNNTFKVAKELVGIDSSNNSESCQEKASYSKKYKSNYAQDITNRTSTYHYKHTGKVTEHSEDIFQKKWDEIENIKSELNKDITEFKACISKAFPKPIIGETINYNKEDTNGKSVCINKNNDNHCDLLVYEYLGNNEHPSLIVLSKLVDKESNSRKVVDIMDYPKKQTEREKRLWNAKVVYLGCKFGKDDDPTIIASVNIDGKQDLKRAGWAFKVDTNKEKFTPIPHRLVRCKI